MKIVVTGGTGFLGRHVVWRALREGHTVRFTGRNIQAAQTVLSHATGDVDWLALAHGGGAQDALNGLTRGADAVVHCAALSSPWGSAADFYRANVVATQEVVRACQINEIPRLVHISTPSLYFDFRDRFHIREHDPLPEPVNEYARTKRLAEICVENAALPQAVILRPRALFGPWDQTLLPRLLRVMQRGVVPLMRREVWVDLTYVDNAVDAVWLALTKPLPQALPYYNVSNNEPCLLTDLLQTIAQVFAIPLRTRRIPWALVSQSARLLEWYADTVSGTEPVITRYSAGVLAFSQTLDVSAIQRDLGWRPSVSIDEGIRRHAAWFKEYAA